MNPFFKNYCDDFLAGSKTVYNYVPATRNPYFFYVQIAGIQKIGPNYYNELEFGREYLVLYVVKGQGTLTLFDQENILQAGDLLFIPNYFHHILRPLPNQDWEFAFLHLFQNDYVEQTYQFLFSQQKYIMHNVEGEKDVLPFIKSIIDFLSQDLGRFESEISALVYSLLMSIYRLSSTEKTDLIDTELTKIVTFLRQNFDKPITFSTILSQTIYSKNHLERLFKEHMKMTMQDFLSRLRLAKAQSLVGSTNLPYKEIANQVGLRDYRALIYMFKTGMGMTPSQYRRRSKDDLLRY